MKKKLNHLLANFSVEAHKLQCFHWYVKGMDFFPVHATLEQLYHEMGANIDALAEVVLQIGEKPLATMEDLLKEASIKEAKPNYVTSDKIFDELMGDYQEMLDGAKELRALAGEKGEPLVEVQMDECVASLSKTVWMLRQSMK